MNARSRAALAVVAAVALFGSAFATFATAASADNLDCESVCNFGFELPPVPTPGVSEVGVQFQADIPGWIAGICFWETVGESGNHAVTLRDSSGATVATIAGVGSPGPESCVDFPAPVAISAGTTYTASYTSNAAYGVDPEFFQFPIDTGHLHAPANAGVLGAAGTFPTTTHDGDGYGVDVAFLSTLSGLPEDCASTLTAPTTPSSAPGDASAVVSWGNAQSDPPGCIVGYIVTPFLGGVAQRATLIPGTGTTTVIPGLTNGQAYAFTVAAESGRLVGPSSTPTGPITIGSPSAVTALKVMHVAPGALKVSFKASRSNGAAIRSFTATCKSAAGVTRSKSAKSGPLTVSHLTAHRGYTCTVRAANRRGTGPPSKRSAAVKA